MAYNNKRPGRDDDQGGRGVAGEEDSEGDEQHDHVRPMSEGSSENLAPVNDQEGVELEDQGAEGRRDDEQQEARAPEDADGDDAQIEADLAALEAEVAKREEIIRAAKKSEKLRRLEELRIRRLAQDRELAALRGEEAPASGGGGCGVDLVVDLHQARGGGRSPAGALENQNVREEEGAGGREAPTREQRDPEVQGADVEIVIEEDEQYQQQQQQLPSTFASPIVPVTASSDVHHHHHHHEQAVEPPVVVLGSVVATGGSSNRSSNLPVLSSQQQNSQPFYRDEFDQQQYPQQQVVFVPTVVGSNGEIVVPQQQAQRIQQQQFQQQQQQPQLDNLPSDMDGTLTRLQTLRQRKTDLVNAWDSRKANIGGWYILQLVLGALIFAAILPHGSGFRMAGVACFGFFSLGGVVFHLIANWRCAGWKVWKGFRPIAEQSEGGSSNMQQRRATERYGSNDTREGGEVAVDGAQQPRLCCPSLQLGGYAKQVLTILIYLLTIASGFGTIISGETLIHVWGGFNSSAPVNPILELQQGQCYEWGDENTVMPDLVKLTPPRTSSHIPLTWVHGVYDEYQRLSSSTYDLAFSGPSLIYTGSLSTNRCPLYNHEKLTVHRGTGVPLGFSINLQFSGYEEKKNTAESAANVTNRLMSLEGLLLYCGSNSWYFRGSRMLDWFSYYKVKYKYSPLCTILPPVAFYGSMMRIFIVSSIVFILCTLYVFIETVYLICLLSRVNDARANIEREVADLQEEVELQSQGRIREQEDTTTVGAVAT